MNRVFFGHRRKEGKNLVFVQDETGKPRELPMRNDLQDHSPDGAEWGYGGSRPAQLALAILCEVFGDDNLAVQWHQKFKWEFIAKIRTDSWGLTEKEVVSWIMDEALGNPVPLEFRPSRN